MYCVRIGSHGHFRAIWEFSLYRSFHKKTYSDQQLVRVTTVVPLIQIQRDSLEMYIRCMALVV